MLGGAHNPARSGATSVKPILEAAYVAPSESVTSFKSKRNQPAEPDPANIEKRDEPEAIDLVFGPVFFVQVEARAALGIHPAIVPVDIPPLAQPAPLVHANPIVANRYSTRRSRVR